MKKHMISAACGLALFCSAPAGAEPVVVVELFTSQGCVSCPPADAFFAGLTQDDRIIPLSLHVDYWDYIGWTDVFGSPRFTERQKNYARAIGSRTIYTPQFIIGGQDRIEGFDPAATTEAVRRQLAGEGPVSLTVQRMGNDLKIEAEARSPLAAPVRVQLVRYLPEETVQIERGENAGKTISYRNVVTSWEVLGDWSGQDKLDIQVPAPGSAPAVVIVQDMGPAAILAASRADGGQTNAWPSYRPGSEGMGMGFLSSDEPSGVLGLGDGGPAFGSGQGWPAGADGAGQTEAGRGPAEKGMARP